jgi:hypothetical protein
MELRKQDDEFWQKLILPEEDRRRLYPERPPTVSYRWFKSPNVVDLWRYRSSAENERIRTNLLRKLVP